jgi:hypothetical protein
MSDYRAYIFGKDGHRFVKIADFPKSHPNDATAMKAARKRVDGHDVELWDAGRLICRFTTAKERLQTLKDFTAATVSGVPSVIVVDVEQEPAE